MMAIAADGDQGTGNDDLSSESEDVTAWADSCLAKDADHDRSFSDDAWASLTKDFISALASFPGDDGAIVPDLSSVDSAESTGIDASGGELISKIAAAAFGYAGADHSFPAGDSSGLVEEIDGERAEAVVVGKEFLEEQDYGDADDEFSLAVSGGAEEDPAKDLFKVWDLRISGEEEEDDEDGELASRLKKALEQTSLIALDDDPKLDSLVSAIGDLSISPPPPGE